MLLSDWLQCSTQNHCHSLNSGIFLKTLFWHLFETANQNIGTVQGTDVKLSNSPLTLMGIFSSFDWQVQQEASKKFTKDVKI